MKLKVYKPKTNDSEHATSWEVIVPESLRTQPPVRNEPFDLTILRSAPLEDRDPGLDGGPVAAQVKCEVIGDGKSIKIGHQVVRLIRRAIPSRKGSLRYRVGLGGLVSERNRYVVPVRPVEPKKATTTKSSGDVKAPMTGRVIGLRVHKGQSVKEDDILVIIEAMKMENQIRSECAGIIEEIRVLPGQSVSIDDILLVIKVDQD